MLHRWVGLAMAGFLLVAGLTGALMVWQHELDGLLNPRLMKTPPGNISGQPMDPFTLRERVQAAYPDAWVNSAPLKFESGESIHFFIRGPIDPLTGKNKELDNNEIFVDPRTGEILGARKWGDIGQGITNLMPFIYRLHYSLALGVVGTYAFGIIALLWTLDCFIGAYLTFPVRSRQRDLVAASSSKPWLARWLPSWKVRRNAGAFKVNFDIHRAGGLWVWAVLFILAWSSVAFNLRDVYNPVMKSLFEYSKEDKLTKLDTPQLQPGLDWRSAHRLGQQHMAEESKRFGFIVVAEQSLSYDPQKGVYRYFVKSSVDVRDEYGNTGVFFDANTGLLKHTRIPTGRYAGDTINNWLMGLHMAQVWGLPFRIFMCFVGILVAALSITGAYIWWNKRRARLAVRTAVPAVQRSVMRPLTGQDLQRP